jgi:hypothetical protein
MATNALRFTPPLLAAFAILSGCAGEDAQQKAQFPRAPGSDSFNEMLADDAQEQQEQAGAATEKIAAIGPDGRPEAIDDSYQDADPSALTDFHDTLDPHGSWIDDPTYGTMWQPSANEVGPDFAPYVSDGHWAYDDASEYVWMSNYSWGWAPFHYGRWAYGGSGWGWIPGRAYAPAWVSWRTGYPGFGYVGWAPMAPTWYWGPGGVAYGLGTVPATPYAFCGVHDLFAPSGLQGHVLSNPAQIQAVAGQTRSYASGGTTTGTTSSPGSSSGGRVPAHPSVTGPSPQSLRLGANEVNHVPASNPQLARAVQFSRPSTAAALGARAPSGAAFASAAFRGGGASLPAAASTSLPGGAVAGHAQLSRPSMPAYGGGAHTYYSSGHAPSTHIGEGGENYYGHGGTYRSFDAPSGSRGRTVGAAGAHGATPYIPPQAVVPHTTTTSNGHFGGHYGGGAHGGGGGHR